MFTHFTANSILSTSTSEPLYHKLNVARHMVREKRVGPLELGLTRTMFTNMCSRTVLANNHLNTSMLMNMKSDSIIQDPGRWSRDPGHWIQYIQDPDTRIPGSWILTSGPWILESEHCLRTPFTNKCSRTPSAQGVHEQGTIARVSPNSKCNHHFSVEDSYRNPQERRQHKQSEQWHCEGLKPSRIATRSKP